MATAPNAAKKKAVQIQASEEVEDVTEALRSKDGVSKIIAVERERWLERHEGAVVKQKKHFGHPTTRKLFERYFEKMSQYLFFIPVFGRAILSQHKDADVLAIEKKVLATLDNGIKHFDARIREAELLITTLNLDSGEENVKIEVAVTFASPMDRKLFDLFEKADQFLLLNQALWVQSGLDADYTLNERKRTDNEWDVKRILKGATYGIMTNHRNLLNAIRKNQSAPTPSAKPALSVVEDNSKPSDLLDASRAASGE